MSVSTPSHWDREAALVREAAAADDAPADNVVAFLAMLAHAEGTPRYGDENGYNVLVGAKRSAATRTTRAAPFTCRRIISAQRRPAATSFCVAPGMIWSSVLA